LVASGPHDIAKADEWRLRERSSAAATPASGTPHYRPAKRAVANDELRRKGRVF
jgi:hypothetical protein